MLASITSVSFHVDAQGVKIELKRTQEQLASLQNDNFGLASAAMFAPVPADLLPTFGAPTTYFGWQADAAMGFKSGIWFGLLLSLRGLRVTAQQDIRLAESLRVSWSSVRHGLKIGAMTGITFPYPTYSEVSKRVATAYLLPQLQRPALQRLLRFLRFFG
jgi:hypothetical protein